MKKILIASDSFKHCLTALEVGDIITKAFKDVKKGLKIKNMPIADGGEGTTIALVEATKGKIIKFKATGPLGSKVNAFIGISKDGKTAFIEMAAASGIEFIPDIKKRNPMITSTIGTGELIKKALNLNAERIIIGIGGSATTDGGAGMAYALGARFYDKNNKSLQPIPKELTKIVKVSLDNLDQRLKKVKILAACDVNNPLYGEKGAAYTYGPQKGATPKMVKELDSFLKLFSNALGEKAEEIAKIPGAGAAGGLGFGLVYFANAKLKLGFKIIENYLNLRKLIKEADLIITGEGRIDFQSVQGKGPIEIVKLAKKYKKKSIMIAGVIEKDIQYKTYEKGNLAIFPIVYNIIDTKYALKEARNSLYNTAYNLARILYK